jgi:hypothetical protein
MWLRKSTGGTAIGPHEWPEDGSVTEVPDQLGRELLAIPEGGFEKVDEPEPVTEITEPGPSAEITEAGEPDAGKPPRKGRAAKAEDTGTPA